MKKFLDICKQLKSKNLLYYHNADRRLSYLTGYSFKSYL